MDNLFTRSVRKKEKAPTSDMSVPEAEALDQLIAMGFEELMARQALIGANNDVSLAISFLTEQQESSDTVELDRVTHYGSRSDSPPPLVNNDETVDVFHDADNGNLPSYEQAMLVDDELQTSNGTGEAQGSDEVEADGTVSSAIEEFPLTNLYELESRVFTESWSIPFRRHESLGKCLLASTALAKIGLAEGHEHCSRFMTRCLPECYNKLHKSNAVQRWAKDIQEGIFDMTFLLMELVAARLQHGSVPIILLEALTLSWDQESEFHFKHRRKSESPVNLMPKYADNTSPLYKDPLRWLTDLQNRFGECDGFIYLHERLMAEERPSLQEYAALLSPFGQASEFLVEAEFKPLLRPILDRSIHMIEEMQEDDLKRKDVGYASDILHVLKLICFQFWSSELNRIDELRLSLIMRMLKTSHFSAKMNSLKEVMKLIDESNITQSSRSKRPIQQAELVRWLVDNKVLSIALEGSLHQAQYCERLKSIMDYLGDKLELDELTTIWRMQDGQHQVVMDNIHMLIACAAQRFTPDQLHHLFHLIKSSWTTENNRSREKLLVLVGKLGKEDRGGKISSQVLELLWELAHLDTLPTEIVEQALKSHGSILTDSFNIKDQVRTQYAVMCIEDIKKGIWVVPAFKQLQKIVRAIGRPSYQKSEKAIISELHKNYDLLKLTIGSMQRCHGLSWQQAKSLAALSSVKIDGRYTHDQCMAVHLRFIGIVLQDGLLYLPFGNAKDIWDCLVANPHACQTDQETCFEWFNTHLKDMDSETLLKMFQQRVLFYDAAQLTVKSFACIRMFYDSVNESDRKMRRIGNTVVVENSSALHGLDYMWQAALNTPSSDVADDAILLLLLAYGGNRMKKDVDFIAKHTNFMLQCCKLLEENLAGVSPMPVGVDGALQSAASALIAGVTPEVHPSKSKERMARVLSIERLLLLAERYIDKYENTSFRRNILPHGAMYKGDKVQLQIFADQQGKPDFEIVTHSNDTLIGVRRKIARRYNTTSEYLCIHHDDRQLMSTDNYKLLHQLYLMDGDILSVRILYAPAANNNIMEISGGNMPAQRQAFLLEQEKQQPSIIMASLGEVFGLLYRLGALCEPKLTNRVRSLLMLIPTDPAVLSFLKLLPEDKDTIISADVGAAGEVTAMDSTLSADALLPAGNGEQQSLAPLTLDALLQPDSPGMSAFRVLYNLEALSSMLSPAGFRVETAAYETACYTDSFLSAGGLPLLLNILKDKVIPSHVDSEIQEEILSRILQLLNLVLTHTVGANERNGSTCSDEISDESMNKKDVLQQMDEDQVRTAIRCFVRVAWSAASGHLHYALPEEGDDRLQNSPSHRPRLRSRICLVQKEISERNALISASALKLIVLCTCRHHSAFQLFKEVPLVKDFIIDVLVGCAHTTVRSAALDNFFQLCNVTGRTGVAVEDSAKYFMLHTLLAAAIPISPPAGLVRSELDVRLMSHSWHYFELRGQLLQQLSADDQRALGIDAVDMLEQELDWLGNTDLAENSSSPPVNTLLTGHLNLTRVLFTCEGNDKTQKGFELIKTLLHVYLFEASKLCLERGSDAGSSQEAKVITSNPRYTTYGSQTAAYGLLVTLARSCPQNLQYICQQLVSMHHQFEAEVAKEWEKLPLVAERSACGYVGLRNASATCYMNSVLQQFHMVSGIKEEILGVDSEEVKEDGMFFQIQCIMAYLMESKKQYFSPEKFWSSFKLFGESINVREQQDAFEFFNSLTDQLDEELKKYGKQPIFQKSFGGVFGDQKLCRGCPHRYEREEPFATLQLALTDGKLKDSLELFVKGELLEGDNAYYCEKCGQKRDTLKRTCIKTMPRTLVMQLKRFGYDWEQNRALKFDDHFEFPWVIDMAPYTEAGLALKERNTGGDASSTAAVDGESAGSESSPPADEDASKMSGEAQAPSHAEPLSSSTSEGSESGVAEKAATLPSQWFELVGVVVHSGQANAGHYYSFIKERQPRTSATSTSEHVVCPPEERDGPPAPSPGKWYRFNDTLVEEFAMSDEALEQECFGGTYKAKVYDTVSFPEIRYRYWNGYMLFYESMSPVPEADQLDGRRYSSGSDMSSTSSDEKGSNVRLLQLEALVKKGEKKGIFAGKLPGRIQKMVHEDNLRFMIDRAKFAPEYYTFVRDLVSCNAHHVDSPDLALPSLHLAVSYLFNTYLHLKHNIRHDMEQWSNVLKTYLMGSATACEWMMTFLTSPEGIVYLSPFLVECADAGVRKFFADFLLVVFTAFAEHFQSPDHLTANSLLRHLLVLLNKEVADHCKTSSNYMLLFYSLLSIRNPLFVVMLLNQGAFDCMIRFLLGPATAATAAPGNNGQVETNVDTGESAQVFTGRRWSSHQSRDFQPLHSILCQLVLSCSVTPYQTSAATAPPMPAALLLDHSTEYLMPMPKHMETILFGQDSKKFAREVVWSSREMPEAFTYNTQLVCYCSWANAKFSLLIITELQSQLVSAPSNELRGLFNMLLRILCLEDNLQNDRIKRAIDGPAANPILGIIKAFSDSDSVRSYQCIKFLVSVCNRCSVAKSFLLEQSERWNWAVLWLRGKMNENFSTSQYSHVSNESTQMKLFQRTFSAQDTLAEADALLTQLESRDQQGESPPSPEHQRQQFTSQQKPVGPVHAPVQGPQLPPQLQRQVGSTGQEEDSGNTTSQTDYFTTVDE